MPLSALCLERFASEASALVGMLLICLGLSGGMFSGYPLSLDVERG